MHFNRINRYILRKTGAKGIGYFWDDHFSKSSSRNILKRLRRSLQRRSVKKQQRCVMNFSQLLPRPKRKQMKLLG